MDLVKLALETAVHVADLRTHRIGAVAVRRDGVIVAAANLPSQHQMLACHAEARVLRKAGKGSTLYIARAMPGGGWGLARPCSGCMNLIRAKKVDKVFYTLGVDQLVGRLNFGV